MIMNSTMSSNIFNVCIHLIGTHSYDDMRVVELVADDAAEGEIPRYPYLVSL